MFKITRCTHAVGLASLMFGSSLLGETFNNLTVNQDATITGAAFLGSVFTEGSPGSVAMTPFPGVKSHVTQGSNEIWNSVWVEGFYQDNWVAVEHWAYVPSGTGSYYPQYTWGIVSEEYIPPVYDFDGNLISEGYWNSTYGNIYTGDLYWPDPDVWGISHTTTENQPVWVPEHYESTYSYTHYNAPLIHQTATRSDANWVWEVPTSAATPRAVMRLWDGGLSLPNYDAQTLMTITPTSIYYSNETGSNSLMDAMGSTHLTQVTNGGTFEESKSEVRPELLRLTRREVSNDVTTIGMTQIAAKSASFGGIVTVEGNLNVLGTITQGGNAVGSGGTLGGDYLTAAQISATYLTSQAAAATYAPQGTFEGMLPRTEAATTYLTGQAAASIYALKTSLTPLLSKAEAAATYVTQQTAGTYALQDTVDTLLPRDEAAMTYLSTADAATTYALAQQVVTPDALTAALADYHRKDQAMVVTHATTFKGGVVLEGEQTNDPDLPNQDPLESRRIVPASGQVMLVPEQGDISMGEFRAGTLPLPAPVP